MKKIKVTLYLDKELWKKFKLESVKRDKRYSEFVEDLLKKFLSKS